ncbi:hypothetical protein U0070_002196, partial [Myodes glareolus]
EENGDYTYVERVKIPLDHGTLLIMEGATQADWQTPEEHLEMGHVHKVATEVGAVHLAAPPPLLEAL